MDRSALSTLEALNTTICACQRCPRLRSHCETIAQIKRKSYAHETYWGKPIHGFGDPQARVMVVGLAPAAHGANRTGRIFTGDRSGEWLYRTLYETGFSNQPHATHVGDGLRLSDIYITCVVKCAPPDNRPSPSEQDQCLGYLKAELPLMSRTRVWVALGKIAYDQVWPLLRKNTSIKKPKFGHGTEISLGGDRHLLLSYHPSQQNTFTGRLTRPMFHSVFERTRKLSRELQL